MTPTLDDIVRVLRPPVGGQRLAAAEPTRLPLSPNQVLMGGARALGLIPPSPPPVDPNEVLRQIERGLGR